MDTPAEDQRTAREQIMALVHSDPVLHTCWSRSLANGFTWEQILEIMVLVKCTEASELRSVLTDFLNHNAAPTFSNKEQHGN